MNTWKTLPLAILTLMAMLLTACVFTNTDQSQQSTPQYSSPLTMTEALMSDPNYLMECRAKYPTKTTNQQIYRNIIPGQTTSATVKSLLGTPNGRTPSSNSEWYYENFTIYFTNGIVDSIYVRYDPQITSNLDSVLRRYGCPNFIYAFDTMFENPSGNYNSTWFVYYDIGLKVNFIQFPISDTTPGMFIFYRAGSFKAYIDQWDYAYYSFDMEKPVTWSEAIKK